MTFIETDVLIVGAGPAGLIASALLARHGVKFISVTKYDSTADSPRAHITNQRSIEIFRDLALQLLFLRASESMGNHDSNVVGAGRVG